MGSGPFGAGSIRAHVADTDPHGDRAFAENFATGLVSAHEALRNPHGLLLSDLLPVYTWATLPSAAANNGLRVHVSDVGEGGSDWKSNGTLWLQVNGSVLLARSAVAASVTGTTSETALATITIPAGVMGLNGQLRVTALWAGTSSANQKTYRIRFGGVLYYAGAVTNGSQVQNFVMVRNRNAANAQVGFSNIATAIGTTANANTTSSIDTSAATTVSISAQLVSAAETGTLDSYTVELLR